MREGPEDEELADAVSGGARYSTVDFAGLISAIGYDSPDSVETADGGPEASDIL